MEVLDPAQNHAFRDHYLDVDFDLSYVIFITTANNLETIPPPLRDRMEIIQLYGYTEYEKIRIAQGFLIPRQLKANGLRKQEIVFTEEALRKVVDALQDTDSKTGCVRSKYPAATGNGDALGDKIKPLQPLHLLQFGI